MTQGRHSLRYWTSSGKIGKGHENEYDCPLDYLAEEFGTVWSRLSGKCTDLQSISRLVRSSWTMECFQVFKCVSPTVSALWDSGSITIEFVDWFLFLISLWLVETDPKWDCWHRAMESHHSLIPEQSIRTLSTPVLSPLPPKIRRERTSY